MGGIKVQLLKKDIDGPYNYCVDSYSSCVSYEGQSRPFLLQILKYDRLEGE